MSAKLHWERIYASKSATEVSWYQRHAELSLKLIERTGIGATDAILDVGGGASTLVDDLIVAGFHRISILDISPTALDLARRRLGPLAAQVDWIEADILQAVLPLKGFAVWHDRAVFHFLTSARDRQSYVKMVRHAVRTGGHIIIATFALDGPEQCSGLSVARYDSAGLHQEFGSGFELMESIRETHATPFGTQQNFIYSYCRRT